MTPDDPRVPAMLKLLARTGALQVQIRFSDDEQPTVWFVVAKYGPRRWETAAAIDPVVALERLCERVIDGGECTHCHRPTAFDLGHDDSENEALSQGTVCWYMWDPELATIRRGCEGNTPPVSGSGLRRVL